MKRLIARLDIKNNRLIKSISYEGLRVIGDINEFALKYYKQGIDELIYIDTVASLYERNSLIEIIKKTTNDIFVPITVGGGVKSIDDINNLLRAGADKIAINSEAIRRERFITEAANNFGSQCIVVSIQAKKIENNKWEAYYLNGREASGKDVIEWAKKTVELGAGEIFVTSVDNDGTQKGLDIQLIEKISKEVSVPVIGSGGAKNYHDIINCLENTDVSAIAVGSILHYDKTNIASLKKLDEKKNYSY